MRKPPPVAFLGRDRGFPQHLATVSARHLCLADRVSSLLRDLAVPVVSAPMAGAAGSELAAAVTAAGGLGMIGVGSATDPDWIEQQTGQAASSGAFGIGLMCWSLQRRPEQLEAALAHSPALVSLSFGDPAPWLDQVHRAGGQVAVQVGTRAEAEAALTLDVDVLVARGSEGGGHGRGEVATLVLLQQVLDLTDRPVLAAGGIATARGLAAVIAAGAVGAWIGTPFAACAESLMAPQARAAIAAADSDQTLYTRAFDLAQRFDWPAVYGGRGLRNDFTDTWADRTAELLVGVDDDLHEAITEARRVGDLSIAPVYAGQSAGLVQPDRTAAEVVAALAGWRAVAPGR